jgi:hypothetical protein
VIRWNGEKGLLSKRPAKEDSPVKGVPEEEEDEEEGDDKREDDDDETEEGGYSE